MSKPSEHARSSARRFGGVPEDYLAIHNWFDQTKAMMPDIRHRAILHSSFGIFLCEQMFGYTITNSEGIKVDVRTIGEQHVMEDCAGRIPSAQDWLDNMTMQPWMHGSKRPKVPGGRKAPVPLNQQDAERERRVHARHCFLDKEDYDGCKYGEDDTCPANPARN